MAPPLASPQQPPEGFSAEVRREAAHEHVLAPNIIDNVQAVRAAVENLALIVRERPAQEQTKLAEAVGIALKAHTDSFASGMQETNAAFEARVTRTTARIAEITKLAVALQGAKPDDAEIGKTLTGLVDGLRSGTKNLDDLSVDIAVIEAAKRSAASGAQSGSLVANWTSGLRRFWSGGSSSGR